MSVVNCSNWFHFLVHLISFHVHLYLDKSSDVPGNVYITYYSLQKLLKFSPHGSHFKNNQVLQLTIAGFPHLQSSGSTSVAVLYNAARITESAAEVKE